MHGTTYTRYKHTNSPPPKNSNEGCSLCRGAKLRSSAPAASPITNTSCLSSAAVYHSRNLLTPQICSPPQLKPDAERTKPSRTFPKKNTSDQICRQRTSGFDVVEVHLLSAVDFVVDLCLVETVCGQMAPKSFSTCCTTGCQTSCVV